MKVLVVTNLFPNAREPNRGIFNLQRLEALSRFCEIRVVAPIAWKPWVHGGGRPVPYEEQWAGIPVVHPFYFYTPRVGRSAYAAWMYCSLRATLPRILSEFQPEALLAAWAYPDAVAVAALARQMRLPWVAEVLGSDINCLAEIPPLRRQIRWALRQASSTVAVSQPLKQKLTELGIPPDAIRVVLNGVNIDRFQLMEKPRARAATGMPAARRIVLYVGNLKVSKGAADLLEAARLLTADSEEMPLFVLVGGGEAHDLLERQIEQHSLQEHVILAGPQPHPEIPTWIAAADVLCLPSHNEGCPNVVLEALACGRPVVASDVGAVPEFVDSTCGAIIPPREPSALAPALQAVLAREWDPEALRKRVLPLSWEENARAVASELEKALRQHEQAAPRGVEAPSAS